MKSLSDLVKEKRRQEKQVALEKTEVITASFLATILAWLKKTFSPKKQKSFLNTLTIILKDLLSSLAKNIFKVRDKEAHKRLALIKKEIIKLDKSLSVLVSSDTDNSLSIVKQIKTLNEAIKSLKKAKYRVENRNLDTLSELAKKLHTLVNKTNKYLSDIASYSDKNLKSGQKGNKQLTDLDKRAKDIVSAIKKAILVLTQLTKKEFPSSISVSNLDELKEQIIQLKEAVVNISFPETDISPVVSAVKEVEDSIKSIRFPVPSFKSSYEHSLSMRLKDAPKKLTYDAGGRIDYIEATYEGKTYRKDLTYDENGNLTDVSAWVQQ